MAQRKIREYFELTENGTTKNKIFFTVVKGYLEGIFYL